MFASRPLAFEIAVDPEECQIYKFGARILEIKVNDANSSDEEGGNLEWVPAKTKSREL
ncbi:predicted protein [Plenodomus lingam JN3]|uniref:Predicted protein n=1 Tax=Leptosphaeria maculans (strain JN3 / isolate v23.1.3 / race Av1-4-5-6-7-8) TaxID=985895 RepID=E5AAA9_LEPMJ|nr:predicted protein [Plenodomus lingam JN3]CBY00600.1 predicted protein [Plenodomus lingam JN3]